MKVVHYLIVLAAAALYSWLWIYLLLCTYTVLGAEFQESRAFESTRGIISIILALLASALLLAPTIFFRGGRNWVIPSAFSLFAFSHLYVYREWKRDQIDMITSIHWALGDLQSALVFVGIIGSPFVVYYGMWRFLYKCKLLTR